MSTERHPITPSRELAQQWTDQVYGGPGAVVGSDDLCLAKLAAQWGADQELEACVQWTIDTPAYQMTPGALRTARRPKPPSLKEEALKALKALDHRVTEVAWTHTDTIRRALEALDD